MRTEEQSEVRGPKSEVTDRRIPGAGLCDLGLSDLGLRTILLAATLLAASVARGDSGRKPTLEALGNEVQCTCGCVAPLNQCPHLDCAEKAEMQAFIKKEIADGKDETAILQDLSLKYGVQVLRLLPPMVLIWRFGFFPALACW